MVYLTGKIQQFINNSLNKRDVNLNTGNEHEADLGGYGVRGEAPEAKIYYGYEENVYMWSLLSVF